MTPTRLAALLLVLPLLALTAACGGGSGEADPSASPSPAPTTSAAAGACTYTDDGAKPARKVEPPPGDPMTRKPTAVTLRTNRGDIRLTLSADETPCTVNSFLSLAKQGYYDDTTCHRLTTAGIFVLQCGDPTGTGAGTPGYRFADELIDDDPRLQPCKQVNTDQGKVRVCTYAAGTVAMANAGKDTNGSQFFLVYRDSQLPPAYTVFGRMSAGGLKVVESVAKAGVEGESQDGPPAKTVKIESVTTPKGIGR